jgi:hypothetical protein
VPENDKDNNLIASTTFQRPKSLLKCKIHIYIITTVHKNVEKTYKYEIS